MKLTAEETQSEINRMLLSQQKGHYKVAQNLALSIIKKFPNHSLSWKVLGVTYIHAAEIENALIANQKAVKLNPNDAEIYLNLGIALKALGKLNEAETSYRKAIELKPDYAAAYFTLGNIVKDLNRLEEAVESYKKSIKLKPELAEVHNNLGTTFQKLRKSNEAEECYRKAIELKPDYAVAYNNLGNTLNYLGRLEEAETNYKKAIELSSNFIQAHRNLDILSREIKLLNIIKDKKMKVRFFDKICAQISKLYSSLKKLDLNKGLKSNPIILERKVEAELINNLYIINSTELSKVKSGPLFGSGRTSNYQLFENDYPIIKNVAENLTNIIKHAIGSEIFVMESFFNILGAGGGSVPHNHINQFDTNHQLINQKFSLVYYLSVGDQKCNDPGIFKVYDPDNEILPSEGMIVIIPAGRRHSAVYGGKTDRVMIGINFYSLL